MSAFGRRSHDREHLDIDVVVVLLERVFPCAIDASEGEQGPVNIAFKREPVPLSRFAFIWLAEGCRRHRQRRLAKLSFQNFGSVECLRPKPASLGYDSLPLSCGRADALQYRYLRSLQLFVSLPSTQPCWRWRPFSRRLRIGRLLW